MTTLTEFLLARIAEDEEAAQYGLRHNGAAPYANDNYGCLLVDPHRVLAEGEAKRHIVEQFDALERLQGNLDHDTRAVYEALEWAVWYLAEVYRDRPDFNEAWRP